MLADRNREENEQGLLRCHTHTHKIMVCLRITSNLVFLEFTVCSYSVFRTCLVAAVFGLVCGNLGNFIDIVILAKSFEEIMSVE